MSYPTPEAVSESVRRILEGVSPKHREGAREALKTAWECGMPAIVKEGEFQYHGRWTESVTLNCFIGSVLVVIEASRDVTRP